MISVEEQFSQYESSLQLKEHVIDRFRERVITLESEV